METRCLPRPKSVKWITSAVVRSDQEEPQSEQEGLTVHPSGAPRPAPAIPASLPSLLSLSSVSVRASKAAGHTQATGILKRMKLTELQSEVLKLDPPTRAWLAEVLLRSLDELSEGEVEALWLDEAERRERAWDAGEVQGIPAEQVMRELRSGSE